MHQTTSHQVHQHTHVLFGQPVEESCWISRKYLIVMESGDGLDALLKLLQARLHTLHLNPTYWKTLYVPAVGMILAASNEIRGCSCTCPASR